MKKIFFFLLFFYLSSVIYAQADFSQKKHLVVIFDKSGSMRNRISDQKKLINNQLFTLVDSLLIDGDYISVLTHGIVSKAENLDDIFRSVEPYKYFAYSSENKDGFKNELLTVVDNYYYGNWNLSYPVAFLCLDFLYKEEILIDQYYVLYITDEQGVIGDLTHEIEMVKCAKGGKLNVEDDVEKISEINKYYHREVKEVFTERRTKMYLLEIKPLYSFIDIIYGFPTKPVTLYKTKEGYKYTLNLDVFNEDEKYSIENVEIEVTNSNNDQIFYKKFENLTDDIEMDIIIENADFDEKYELSMKSSISYNAGGLNNFLFDCYSESPNICNTVDKTCIAEIEPYKDVLWFKMNDTLFSLFAKDGENQDAAINRLKLWFWILTIIMIPIIFAIIIVLRNKRRNKNKTTDLVDKDDISKQQNKKVLTTQQALVDKNKEIGKNTNNEVLKDKQKELVKEKNLVVTNQNITLNKEKEKEIEKNISNEVLKDIQKEVVEEKKLEEINNQNTTLIKEKEKEIEKNTENLISNNKNELILNDKNSVVSKNAEIENKNLQNKEKNQDKNSKINTTKEKDTDKNKKSFFQKLFGRNKKTDKKSKTIQTKTDVSKKTEKNYSNISNNKQTSKNNNISFEDGKTNPKTEIVTNNNSKNSNVSFDD